MGDVNGNEENKQKCPYCGEEHDFVAKDEKVKGTHVGSGKNLSISIRRLHYNKKKAKEHPFASYYTCGKKSNGRYKSMPEAPNNTLTSYISILSNRKTKHEEAVKNGVSDEVRKIRYQHWSPEAHHLIATQTMAESGGNESHWEKFCEFFGYNINHSNNGVFLPKCPQVACANHVPLHFSNHDRVYATNLLDGKDINISTFSDAGATPEEKEAMLAKLQMETWVTYLESVTKRIKEVLENVKSTDCEELGKDPCKALDKKSNQIWKDIMDFKLTLTFDALNYKKATPTPGMLENMDKWGKELKALNSDFYGLDIEKRMKFAKRSGKYKYAGFEREEQKSNPSADSLELIKKMGMVPGIGCMHARMLKIKQIHYDHFNQYCCKFKLNRGIRVFNSQGDHGFKRGAKNFASINVKTKLPSDVFLEQLTHKKRHKNNEPLSTAETEHASDY